MIEKVYQVLVEKDIRLTPQREAIIKVLNDAKGHHLETEDIYMRLNKEKVTEKNKIGIATVYRTMELFDKEGLVSKLTIENMPAKYELVIPNTVVHHHLICSECRKIEEIDDDIFENLKEYLFDKKSFKMDNNSTIKIHGCCSDCLTV